MGGGQVRWGRFGPGAGDNHGVRAGAFALLVVGVAGALGRFDPSGRRARSGAGAIAGGFSLLAGTERLR